MESDTTVILGRGGLPAVKRPSRTTRTESTAVFVGRASFQMIPAQLIQRRQPDDVTLGPTLRRAQAPALAEARMDEAPRTPTPGPTVILSSDIAQIDETAAEAAPGPRGVVLQMRPQVDVTEPIDTRVRARSVPRARRGGVSARTVVLALIAGASITLSAQAVIEHPGAQAPVAVTAAAAPKQAPPVRIETSAARTAPATVAPTVVASTVPVAPHQTVAELPAPTPRKRPKVVRTSVASVSAAGTAKARSQSRATWVDPFADEAPVKTTSKTTNKTASKTWVDPFVD